MTVVGLAPCFFHPDPDRPIFKGKRLLYLEESLAHWLMRGGAAPLLLPTPAAGIGVRELLAQVDGLVLQGGSDVAPGSYGEEPLRAEWSGDEVRDRYEVELIRACIELDVPVLAVCRGVQILNVALGGTLYQDIAAQHEAAQVHRDPDRYDRLCHEIRFEPDSLLARLYPGRAAGRVNSVHHQAIRRLAPGLRVEATSEPDGLVEAVRYEPEDGSPAAFLYGVQWHPEFQDPEDTSLLDPAPIRDHFLEACSG